MGLRSRNAVSRPSMHLREVRYCVVRTTKKVDASCTWLGLGFGLGSGFGSGFGFGFGLGLALGLAPGFGLGLGLGGRLVHLLLDTGVISSVQYRRL